MITFSYNAIVSNNRYKIYNLSINTVGTQMSNLANDLENAELISADNGYWVALKNSYTTLQLKQAFNTLVVDGYIKEKTAELVQALIDPYVMQQGLRTKVLEQLVAIARLKEYFNTIRAMGGHEDVEKLEAEEDLEYRNKVNALKAAADSLSTDSAFIKVITEGFLKEHAVRQTSLLAIESMNRSDVLEALSGISHFQQYLLQVQRNAAELSFQNEVEGE